MEGDPAKEDRMRHNEWVESVASEIDFDPLREFVLRLLEPECDETPAKGV